MLLTDSWDELVLMDLGSAASAECTITSRSGSSCVLRNTFPDSYTETHGLHNFVC